MPRRLGLVLAVGVFIGAPAWGAPSSGASSPAGRSAAVVMFAEPEEGHQRLVFDLPPGESGVLTQDGTTLTVRFASRGVPSVTTALPANAQSVHAAEGVVEVTLAPGVRAIRTRLRDRLVVELVDPASPHSSASAPHAGAPSAGAADGAAALLGQTASPAAPPPALWKRPGAPAATRARAILPSRPEAVSSSEWRGSGPLGQASAAAEAANAASPASGPAPVEPVAATPLPAPAAPGALALAAETAAPIGGAKGEGSVADPANMALRLPFGAQTGAAAFRLGDDAMLVFDERRPIDAARLRDDPRFAGLTVQLLQGGTLIRLPLAAGRAVALSRSPGAWTIRLDDAPAALDPIRPTLAAGEMRLPAAAPGRVVSVPNALTGGVLLVGTQLSPGQGVPVARRSPVLSLLPTWQGVAVDPSADAIVLRAEADGFVVTGDGPGRPLALAVSDADAGAMAEAAVRTRRFDLPALSVDALSWRLRAATAEAAATPAQSRTRARLRAAQAMIALGLGDEAQGLLGVVASDDPQAASDPDEQGLTAIAALLADRPAEADGLDDPRLGNSDEIATWRAIRLAMRGAAAEASGDVRGKGAAAQAAPVLASNVSLLLGYPAPLRARVLPLAAETMVQGGEAAAASRLLASRPDDHSLDLARASLADMQTGAGGDVAGVLALYDGVAAGKDRLARFRAADAAVELRLKSGQFSAAQAADAMDRLLVAWRGDGREFALRLREAELWRDAGEWRRGLALLRETASAWPDRKQVVDGRLADMFGAALADDAKHSMPPLDFVALAEENADLIPGGEPGQRLATVVADRLAALDLPARAIPALAHLMSGSPPGPARAAFGARLAAWRLQNHDPGAAIAALDASDSSDLASDLAESRSLLRARADGDKGDLPSAIAVLAGIDTAAADDLRASLEEAAKDWPAATAALQRCVARVVAADGPLDPSQARLMLRLASAAAQGGDEATLADLRAHYAPRMPQGDAAHLFDVLTEPPIRQATDLSRAARETDLARTIPAALKALPAAPAPNPRAPLTPAPPAAAATPPVPQASAAPPSDATRDAAAPRRGIVPDAAQPEQVENARGRSFKG